MKTRALVVGLDSAPLRLLGPWIKKGYLPTFAKIIGGGASGDLYSAIPVTPVAWSSIYTGLNPGRHGILGFMNHRPGTYGDFAVNSTLRDGRDLWEVAGSYGRKVVVVNAPLSYPPRPVNGYLVCGFMAPGTEHEFTYPPSLSGEIRKVFPGYRLGTAPVHLKGKYLRELIETVRMVGGTAAHLMKQVDWDLAFVVFKETDEVQHSFYDRPESMLALYREVDRQVEELLVEAGDQTYTFVVSDHGGEPFTKRFNVADFLRRSGYVKVRPARRSVAGSVFRGAARAVSAARMEWIFDVPGAKALVQALIRARVSSLGPDSGDGFMGGVIDWSNTIAFISSGVGLRLNVKGREPQGCIELEDYRAVLEKIASELAALRDPENGHTVFRHSLPRDKVLSGPHLEEAPDILVLPDEGYLPTEALASFDPLTLSNPEGALFSKKSPWSGTHSPFGVFAASGPGVRNGSVEGARLEDVAPTVLYAMGLPVPQGLDGRVLTDAFTAEHLESHPLTWEGGVEPSGSVVPRQLSKDEERKIEERLKSLGYLS